jgi:hypothetical protein
MMLCEVPLRMQGRHASPVLLQDFRFWQWYCWRFKFSVLRHCVVGWVVPDISKNCGHIPEELNLQILFPMWYSFETHYNFLWGIYDLWWWEFQWVCTLSLFFAVELLVVVQKIFFCGVRVTLLKKRNCIAVSMNWSLRTGVSFLLPLILVCSNHMTVLLVTDSAQSWVQRIKGCREHTAELK